MFIISGLLSNLTKSECGFFSLILDAKVIRGKGELLILGISVVNSEKIQATLRSILPLLKIMICYLSQRVI